MSKNETKAKQSASKDRQRFSIELGDEHRDLLAGTAKRYKVTRGEVIEVLLDRVTHDDGLAAALAARREEKVAARRPKKDLMDQLNLTPAQLAAALAAAH